MLVQGLRSDLMTLGLFAAPAVALLPLLLAIGRVTWWVRVCCVWFAASLVAIIFLEFATPQFLIEYDSRPNRLFLEYLVYPQEVLAMLWNGYRGLLLLTAAARCGTEPGWSPGTSRNTLATREGWRSRTVLLVWPIVLAVLFVMVRSSFQHRPANLATFAFCDDAMVNSLVANSAYSVLSAAYGLKNETQSSWMYGDMPMRRNGAAGARRNGCAARRLHIRRAADAASTGCDRAAARSRSTWSSCWRRASAPDS